MKSSTLLFMSALLVALVALWFGFPQPSLDMDFDILPLARARMGLEESAAVSTPLEGLVVVVTGATSGIGLGLTLSLMNMGATVVAIGRSQRKLAELDQTVANHTGSIVPVLADLSDLESVAKASKEIQAKFDRIDVLVNNAGMHYRWATFSHPTTPQGHDLSFGVNYLSHFLLTERLIPLLSKATHPAIVQTSSTYHWAVDGSELRAADGTSPIASQKGAANLLLWRDQRAYANAKLAQVLHMRSLQREHPRVRSVSVCPAWVATQIGGKPGYPGHYVLSHLAFPLHGFGIRSMLHAILETKANELDFYYNTDFVKVFGKLPKLFFHPMLYRTGVRDLLSFIIASTMILVQKFMPGSTPGVSSPESYDVVLQDSLYQWSKQAVSEYL